MVTEPALELCFVPFIVGWRATLVADDINKYMM